MLTKKSVKDPQRGFVDTNYHDSSDIAVQHYNQSALKNRVVPLYMVKTITVYLLDRDKFSQ